MFECMVGRRVRFVYQQRTLSGVVSGLDSDGALLVQSPEYAQLRLTSGEVIFE
jgi:biotin-(acetyl-CoA carboxylase) ligase